MEPIAVERSIWINTSPERAWQAVTDAGQLTRWYATQHAWDIPVLAVGATVRFHNSATDILRATIEVLDPPREFTVRWKPGAEYPDVSLVTRFRLAPEDGGTRVTIYESGYENVPAAERAQWLEATGGGYSMSVQNLKALLEGQPLPYQ